MYCKRLLFTEKQKCEIEEYELPEIEDNQVLIKTGSSLISAGTELAMFNRIHRGFDDPENKNIKYPFRPGYALVGKIIDTGKNVTDLKKGDKVFYRGKHSDYCIADAANCTKLNDDMSEEKALFLVMAEIAMTSIRLAPLEFGGNVIVSGMGVVGNLCAQLYALSGAGIAAGADISKFRLDIAKRCGIEFVCDVSKTELKEYVSRFPDSKVDIVVEAVGLNSSLCSCFKAVSKYGTLVLLGSPRTQLSIDPYYDIHVKGVKIVGAHASLKAPRYNLPDKQLILSLLNSNKLKTEFFLSENVFFEKAQDAYKKLSEEAEQYVTISLRYDK